MTKQKSPNDLGEPWRTDPECGHESILDRHGKLVADCAIFGPGTSQEQNQRRAARIVELVNAAAKPAARA